MTRVLPLLAVVAALTLWLPERAAAQAPPAPAGRTLQAFGSGAEIAELYRRLRREEEEWRARQPPQPPVIIETDYHSLRMLVYPPDPAGTPRQFERPVLRDYPETAVRLTGGDERGFAQVQGDYLVALHRGRLFTVRIGGGALQPVSTVDAFGPHVSHLSGFQDELLVSGDRVVVIGNNERLYGTELSVFHLAPDGRLTHRATYHLPSTSSLAPHTYAARVVGGRLFFYAPLRTRPNPQGNTAVLHRWGADSSRVHAAVPPTRIYRPAEPIAWDDRTELHTVLACDLPGDDLRCEATALLAPHATVQHVSPTSVYLWTGPRGGGSMLYRLPLDGSAPTALRVSGKPVDAFSFLESSDGHLNVLVRADETSIQRWGPAGGGSLALLRVPLSALGDGSAVAAPGQYHPLPSTGEIVNRYVGDWLVYGSGMSPDAYAVRWATGRDTARLPVVHRVERIEAMGSDAALVGADGRGLNVSTLRLGSGAPVLAHHYTLPGETRSHGFFYRPAGDGAGVLGLPVRSTERPPFVGPGYPDSAPVPPGPPLFLGPTRIHFLRSQALRLGEAGELAARAPSADVCFVGCSLWYGNAQPLFVGARSFALLGYELVEGRETAGSIREVRRVSFAPDPPTAGITGDWTFYESVGAYQSRYYCANRGTMRLDRNGSALTMRYRQTGECTIDGAKTKSDGEGSGSGTVSPAGFNVQVGPCQSTGALKSAHYIDGTLRCRIQMPDGSMLDVNGSWTARRTPP